MYVTVTFVFLVHSSLVSHNDSIFMIFIRYSFDNSEFFLNFAAEET